MPPKTLHSRGLAFTFVALLVTPLAAPRLARGAETEAHAPSPRDLKDLSLEDLFNLEVTSVSRKPERFSETASAIQVITGEEIHRSGARSLPEALRLVTNLEVAQVSAHDWAITARGMNGAPLSTGSLADKLLVLVDGRTVYTPLFGGVFWDVQGVSIEDIERIEVISGPGGTVWGANAVNGVINVVTKTADQGRGLTAEVRGGSLLEAGGAVRYGGAVGKLAYRTYVQRVKHGSTEFPDGTDFDDNGFMTQGGFRADHRFSDRATVTLQGDVYGGEEGRPTQTRLDGHNLIARYSLGFSATSQLVVQSYYDRAWRKVPVSNFTDLVETIDLDFQHRFAMGNRQTLVWGAGWRNAASEIRNDGPPAFVPPERDVVLSSAFLQDEIALVPDRLMLTLGSKFEHQSLAGDQILPSGRLAWTPSLRHTVWGAVSRAVRSPSRFDADFQSPTIVGNPDFESEELLAYELGWHTRPVDVFSASVAGFYNRYDRLRSLNFVASPPPIAIFENDQKAETGGVELMATLEAVRGWRLQLGYTYLREFFEATDPAVVPGSDRIEAIDPKGRFQFHSSMDLPHEFQLDVQGRAVASLPPLGAGARLPGYFTMDARLAWHSGPIEVSAVGRNLWEPSHREFGTFIPRSVFGEITCRVF